MVIIIYYYSKLFNTNIHTILPLALDITILDIKYNIMYTYSDYYMIEIYKVLWLMDNVYPYDPKFNS